MMEFSWAGEINQPVDRAYVRMCRYIEKKFWEFHKDTSLEHLEAKVNFCPILMNESQRLHFPARSKLSEKDCVFYCSPQLDYDLFLTDNLKGQLNNCIDELLEAAEPLRKLGATDEQVTDYINLFERMRR